MKIHVLIITIFLLMVSDLYAQGNDSKLPYHEIPPYPENYSPGNVAARVVDGLGYRYFWATEGLTEKDLKYKPSEDARTTGETIDHIYALSLTIVNATASKPNVSTERSHFTFGDKRRITLDNIKMASDNLKSGKPGDMDNYKVIFQREDGSTEYPFWNMLNGPIADAIYHTGQIVSFRRSSGNPLHPGVRVFTGKTSE